MIVLESVGILDLPLPTSTYSGVFYNDFKTFHLQNKAVDIQCAVSIKVQPETVAHCANNNPPPRDLYVLMYTPLEALTVSGGYFS